MEAMTRKQYKTVTLMTKMLKIENFLIGLVSGNRSIPYLQDGTLDQVFEYKSLLNKDKTAQEYKEYYTKGYQTDVSKIAH